MKKTYSVHIPVYAYIDVVVEAEDEEEALELAEQKAEDDSTPLEFGDFSDREDWYVREGRCK